MTRAAVVLLLLAGAAPKWTTLRPESMTSAGGATLSAAGDGAILASGENPAQDTFTVTARAELKGITGFRLEALPDGSLPAGGPGRAGNGNIVLSEFRVAVDGKPVTLRAANADFSQNDWPVANAIDGKPETGWAVAPQFGISHVAVFETAQPVSGDALTFTLEFLTPHGQHVIGRFRLSVTADRNPAREAIVIDRAKEPPPPPPVIDEARVDQAIKRGIEILRSLPSPPHGDIVKNSDELILWTFVHAGVPESDPKFQQLLKTMLQEPLERTYKVALQAMILEELDRAGYQGRIAQCAQFLIDNQCANGQWSYGSPTEGVKNIPATEPKKEVATSGGVREYKRAGERVKPKVTQKIAIRRSREGPAEGDNSNSQYASLGLRACYDAGILIPEATVMLSIHWWKESQLPDPNKDNGYGGVRGWNYTNGTRDKRAAYHAMTAGAIGSLTIFEHMIKKDWKKDPNLKAGVNWLAGHLDIGPNYYYLYAIERAGVLYGTETFGRLEWYAEGAKFILANQAADGTWGDSKSDKPDVIAWTTWNTCFAILFLKRATRPLVETQSAGSRK